jgi:hypothetical protein
MTSFENKIIIEKYIIKLKELSCSTSNNYVNNRFSLIVKYMNGDTILDSVPLSQNYFNIISSDFNKVPFLIKSDLYSELTFLDSLNQGNLLKVIKDLKSDYNNDIKKEAELRSTMDDGQIIERNLNLLEEFKNEFGYDPINDSILSKHDDFNLNDGNDDLYITFDKTYPEEARDDFKNQSPSDSNTQTTNINSNTCHNSNSNINSNIFNLDALNQLFDIMKVDFNEIIKDVVKSETSTTTVDKKKKTTTRKKKTVESATTSNMVMVDSTTGTTPDEITDYKKHIEDLVSNVLKMDLGGVAKETAIKSILEIALIYKIGKILRQSNLKANLLYIYLIKKFNNSEAMYLLGEELIEGSTIQKNAKYGAQLIKAAADDKHPKALTRIKYLMRAGNSRVSNNYADDVVSSSDEND